MTGETPAIPRIDLSGTPYEIGHQHGTLLRSQILSQLEIYRTVFKLQSKLEWTEALAVAKEFQPTIQRLAPHLYREIEGIAAGVGGDVSLFDIIALNALGTLDGGSTSLAWTLGPNLSKEAKQTSPRRQILAQNWDWSEEVGKNLAMVSITQSGKPKIWMVIEPGMVGMIGFNSASVGVCFNDIHARSISTKALPIHLLLRIALECDSVGSAIAEFERLGGAASSQYILIADAASGSRGLEVSPLGNEYLAPDEQGLLVHSNHFLKNKFVEEVPTPTGSPERLARIKQLSEKLHAERLELDGDTTTGGATTGGAMTGGAMTGGAMTGGAMTGGAMTGGAMTGGAMTGGAMTGGAMTGGAMTGGAMTGGAKTFCGLMIGSVHLTGSMRNGEMSNGSMKNGSMENGLMKSGKLENGGMTNGPLKNGGMENGPMTNGPMTNGDLENGGVAEGETVGLAKADDISPTLLRERVFSDKEGAPQGCDPQPDGRTLTTLSNIIMVFAPGEKPVAEVLFGRPGPDNIGPVLRMPW